MSWAPPRKFCRMQLIGQFVSQHGIRSFVDIGCGEGHLSVKLAKMGLTGQAFDVSEEAVELTRQKLASLGSTNVSVRAGDLFVAGAPHVEAQAVLFLEVLEHLDDDISTLIHLREFVTDEGFLILSVPAHAKLWDALDEWAGHVRRYEKQELEAKLHQTGWEITALYNYGFPFVNLLRAPRAMFYSKLAKDDHAISLQDATERSGIHRLRNVGPGILWTVYGHIAALVQRPFLRTDLGEGYLVLARKAPVPSD